MAKTLPKPPVASYSIWKTFFLGMGVSLLFTFLVWLFGSFPPLAHGELPDWSLSFWDILLGIVLLPVSFYSHWAWHPRRKYGRWHRWFVNLIGSFYVSFLFLLGCTIYWNALLVFPWDWLVNGVVAVLFVLVWALPAISFSMAKRIQRAQDTFSLKLLKFGGPASLIVLAGILGANFGLHGSADGRLFSIAFLMPLLAVGLAQFSASNLWPYRPWAKEEEE